MPIAKETLKIGFTVAAIRGNYISKEAVKKYGWQELVVDDGVDLDAEPVEPVENVEPAEEASAPRPRKAVRRG